MEALVGLPERAGETALELMSELLGGLVVGVVPAGLSDEELEADLAGLRRLVDVAEAWSAGLVAELNRRRSAVAGGFSAVAGFLTATCGMSSGGARQLVRVAEALGHMPVTRELFERGEISAGKVRVLAPAASAYPELFAEHEPTLVEAARALGVGRLRRVVAYWRGAVDWDAATRDVEGLYARRYLSVSRTFEGMVKLDGLFDPVDGETILTALAAATTGADRAAGAEPWRGAGQRRADGLVGVCRRFLDRGAVTVAGERPHVSLVVDLPTLQRLSPSGMVSAAVSSGRGR